MLKFATFRRIEAKKNAHLEEFMLSRMITNNFQSYIDDVATFFQKQQMILENEISKNNEIDFNFDIQKYDQNDRMSQIKKMIRYNTA